MRNQLQIFKAQHPEVNLSTEGLSHKTNQPTLDTEQRDKNGHETLLLALLSPS